MPDIEAKVPPEVEEAIRGIAEQSPPEQAAWVLADLARRAAVELHKLARNEANSRRGTEDWSRWARLVNAAREALLNATSCREVAADLKGKGRSRPS